MRVTLKQNSKKDFNTEVYSVHKNSRQEYYTILSGKKRKKAKKKKKKKKKKESKSKQKEIDKK